MFSENNHNSPELIPSVYATDIRTCTYVDRTKSTMDMQAAMDRAQAEAAAAESEKDDGSSALLGIGITLFVIA